MILHLEGESNRYYVQTLCMVFFPGAKFGEHEEITEDTPVVSLTVSKNSDGSVMASAEMTFRKKTTSAIETVYPDANISASRIAKIAEGRAIFSCGKAMFGHIPPWGILTGVRPAKVATELLNAGNGILKSKKILRDEYFLNPQKAALAVSVASTEMKLCKALDPDLCSVYISIPFCPSRCAYCSFVSYTSEKLLSLIPSYLSELERDMDEMFETIRMLGKRIASVYIGGGTPTTLSAEQLRRLLSRITAHVDPASLLEFTMEAGRPDTITAEKLQVAREYGVTRISVNPQTLSDEILESIGRRHTVEDFFRAYEIARESGIPNINVDLIAGLPEDTFSNFSSSLDQVIELAPSNITVHTFCVKKASDVLRENSNVYSLTGGDAAKCVSYSQLKTKFAGYRPYYMYRQKNTVGNLENVGYAKEGAEGMYNIFMMEEIHSIFAVGAGAVTKLVDNKRGTGRIERLFTPKYPYEYLRDAEKIRCGLPEEGKKSARERILDFFE
jgi:oxygen-independent coproporphyrinogen-3 oxidase